MSDMESADDLLLKYTGSAEAAEEAKYIAVEAVKIGMKRDELPDASRAYRLHQMFQVDYDKVRNVLMAEAVKRAGGWDAVVAAADEMGFDSTAWNRPTDG